MRRNMLFFVLLVSAVVIAASGVYSKTTASVPIRAIDAGASGEPVLIELFTSQGCSSCPPADRLAQRMAREDGLVVILRPVDYWDRLGWKDTLARPENTVLQRAYARRGLGGYNGVYTPQSVVAGALGEVGSDERALRGLVRAARAAMNSNAARLRVKLAGDKGHAIGIAGKTSTPAELMLIGVSTQKEVAIGRGENGGRTIHYTNVLTDEQRLAMWDGGQSSVPLYKDRLNMSGADRYAIVLRVPGGGPVLAARWLEDAAP